MSVLTTDRTIVGKLIEDYSKRPYLPKHTIEEVMYWEGQQSVINELKRRLQLRDSDKEII